MLRRRLVPGESLGIAYLKARSSTSLAMWRPVDIAARYLKAAIRIVAPKYTMVSIQRLGALARIAANISKNSVEGCIVECGTWRGGSIAIIDWAFRDMGAARDLWAFDSFEGLPPPGDRDPHEAHKVYYPGICAARETDVIDAVKLLGGEYDRLSVVRRWLEETLPMSRTGPIALLNIDVDWCDSVRTVLNNLFERVSPGGIVNLYDYGCWKECDRAVHEFLRE